MARLSGDEADQAAAREQHDAEQDEPEEELPALGQAAEHEFEQHEQSIAPATGPNSRPVPPRMTSTISSPDICQDSIDGLTKRLRSANSAPAIPVIMAEITKAASRIAERLDADRSEAHLVLPRRLQRRAEARVAKPPHQRPAPQQQARSRSGRSSADRRCSTPGKPLRT